MHRFHRKAGVVGVSRGYKVSQGRRTRIMSTRVWVEKKLPLWRFFYQPWNKIPRFDDAGNPTDVVEVGKLEFLQRTGKHRPIPGGVSTGHPNITAGSVGFPARDNDPASPHFGKKGWVSNNHVWADLNRARIGDGLFQPGRHDGGTAADIFGPLVRFVEIQFSQDPCAGRTGIWYWICLFTCLFRNCQIEEKENRVDAAFAVPHKEEDHSDEILGLGKLAGVAVAKVGVMATTFGRTSGEVSNPISDIDVEAVIDMGDGTKASFVGCFACEPPILQGGDSGSPTVYKGTREVIGIGFAGSNQISLHIPVKAIIEELKVEPIIT